MKARSTSSMQLSRRPGKSMSSPPMVSVAKLGLPKAGRSPTMHVRGV
jgi:hypothetical protein